MQSNQSKPILWLFGIVSVSLTVGTGTIGCGDEKKKTKKDPASATETATSTAQSTGSPAGSEASKGNESSGKKGKSPSKGTSTGPGDAADDEAQSDTEEDKEDKVEPESAAPGGAAANPVAETTPTFYTSKDFPQGTQKLSSTLAASSFATNATNVLLPYIPVSIEESPECMAPLENSTWTGDAKNIKLEIDKTVDCKAGTDFAKYDVKVKLNFQYSCKNEVFSGVVGKTVKATRGTNLLKYCKESVANHQASGNMIISLANKGTPTTPLESTLKWAVSTANGSPCTIITTKSTLAIADDCQGYLTSKDLSNSGDTVTSTLIGKYRGAAGPLEDKALNAGFFDFSINNWKGALRFNSNAAAPFQATDGNTIIQDYLK